MAVKPKAERRSGPNWLVIASLLALFVAALFLRGYWNIDVATSGGDFVLAAGSDPYYHKRAIDYIQASGFETLLTDPMLNYPYGSVNPNPPLYEWSVAVAGHVLAPFFSPTETLSAEQVATWYAFLWSPAVYGALLIFPIYFIGKTLFSRTAGLLAAFFWTLSTTSIDTTGVGSADHDPAYMLFVALAFLFYIKAIAQFRGDGHWVASWSSGSSISHGLGRLFRERRVGILYALLAGVSTGAVALVWKGFPYVLGILFAYAGLQMLLDHWRNRDSTGLFVATFLAMVTGVAMAAPYYAVANLGNFLTPGLFLAGAFLVAGLVLVPTRDLPTILVMPAAALTAIVGAVVAILALPAVANSLLGPIIYFKRTALYETIAEAHPADFSTLVFSVGPIPYFLAIAGFVIVLLSLRKNTTRAGLFAVVWAAVAMYMAMSAIRFVFNALPIIAIFAGFGMARLLAWLDFGSIRKSLAANHGNFWQGFRKGVNGWHIAGAFFILFLLVVPNVILAADAAIPRSVEIERCREAALSDAQRELCDENPPIESGTLAQRFYLNRLGAYGQGFIPDYWADGLEWLAAHDENITDASERPAFLAWWDYGHWAIYVGEHPTVADNFQNGYEYAANFLLAQNETQAVQLLAARLIDLMPNDRAEALLAEAGVEDPEEARVQLERFQFVEGMSLETANAALALFEAETGKSIRYFTTDVRMLPLDNPQTLGFIEQPSIFYAPVRLAGEDPDDYVATQIQVGGQWVTQEQYREIASDPITGPLSQSEVSRATGERLTYLPAFFNSMYWRGYVGTQPPATGPVQGDQVYGALNQPAPGKDLEHFRLVYANGGLRTLEYFRGASVTGTITENGEPVSDVRVVAYDDAGQILLDTYPESVRGQLDPEDFNIPHGRDVTDAEGRYELTAPFALEGGAVTLVATRADGTEIGREKLAITREDAAEGRAFTADFQVVPGSVEGFVFEDVDGDGQYVAENDTLASGVEISVGDVSATTDEAGRYRVEGVSPGRQDVSVESTRFVVSDASDAVRVLPGETVTHNVSLVPRPTTVEGVAYADLDENGTRDADEGLGFATLTFTPDASVENNTAEAETATTDNVGRYAVELTPGVYVVTGQTTIEGDTYALERTVTVVEGEDQELDLLFERAAADEADGGSA